MKRLPFSEYDFEEWRDGEVTRAVFAAFRQLAAQAKEEWLAASWENGRCEPVLLADLRARAQTAEDIVSVSFQAIEKRLITEADDEQDGSKQDE